MKVLVIGSEGRQGARFCAILKYLGVEYEGVDIGLHHGSYFKDYSHAIIATPTDTHLDYIEWCRIYGIRHILCEKPIDKNPDKIKELINIEKETKINMVCNWKYALGNKPIGTYDIHYSNYNTGKDGVGWDCIQLIYLANTLKIDTNTPYFFCQCLPADNMGRDEVIELYDIEQSYITMIKHWLELDDKKNDLWDLEDALKATNKVIAWEKA